jgi:uncharacterized protein YbjT (DUF2867 family)
MKTNKTIVVMGATGAQGGGLVRAILSDPDHEFSVRGVTTDKSSDKATELINLGAEVIEANLDNPESINKAFQGAYGVFCVTFFWHHFSPEKEKEHARTMAEAASNAGVKHVIWSTLEDTRNWIPLNDDRMPTLKEKYKVPHFDAKGESNHFFTDLGLPVTLLNTSFYWENFIYFGQGPKKGPDGKLALSLPMDDKKLPGIAASDIGKCALGIFKAGDKYIGKTLGIAGEHLTGTQMAEAFSNVLGKEVVYNPISPEVYRGFGFPGADDMGNMYQFKRDFEKEYTGSRDLEFTRSLNPSLISFKEFLNQNKNLIPLD